MPINKSKYFIPFIMLSTLFFVMTNQVEAAIQFSDGKWETTFDCTEYTIHTGTLDCDGLSEGGAWTADGQQTAVTNNANNLNGIGGNGARFWKGSGSDSINSGSIFAVFPTTQREIWVRWYERYESGFSWGGTINVKSLYFKSSNGNPYTGFYGENSYRMYDSLIVQNPLVASGGWGDIYPNGTSDGSWHSFEAHLKMDTDGTDGFWQAWIDGELKADYHNLNYGAGAASHQGWTSFEFLSNQKDPGLTRTYYVDVDDIVIDSQTPLNVDSNGNHFIGPIGWTNESDEIAPDSPTGLSVL